MDLAFRDTAAPCYSESRFNRHQVVLQPSAKQVSSVTPLWVASAIHGSTSVSRPSRTLAKKGLDRCLGLCSARPYLVDLGQIPLCPPDHSAARQILTNDTARANGPLYGHLRLTAPTPRALQYLRLNLRECYGLVEVRCSATDKEFGALGCCEPKGTPARAGLADDPHSLLDGSGIDDAAALPQRASDPCPRLQVHDREHHNTEPQRISSLKGSHERESACKNRDDQQTLLHTSSPQTPLPNSVGQQPHCHGAKRLNLLWMLKRFCI